MLFKPHLKFKIIIIIKFPIIIFHFNAAAATVLASEYETLQVPTKTISQFIIVIISIKLGGVDDRYPSLLVSSYSLT